MKENTSKTNQKSIHLEGIYPPLPTPFDEKGEVSTAAIKSNLAFLNRFDLRGFVVLGTNGEYVMLNEKEKLLVMQTARAEIPRDKLMIAGTGCQSTAETIELTKKAAEIGVDAVLIITPSYYKSQMTPATLIHHFHVVADNSPVPILVYNMPACTGVDLEAEPIITLAHHDNIIGVKDSSGNVVKLGNIYRHVQQENLDFQILAGSAGFLLPALTVGAVGGVLALANIAPAECIALHRFFLEGNLESARDLQVRMIPVNAAVTARWSVPGLKAAMDLLGMYGGPVRQPLLPTPDDTRKILASILVEGGIKK
ncbi:MAG: dihydrodipicolinate synthase family protein [Acidobacteria bacterium]|jgi:4-hydroxy-2-oxoglutarate aldolase|nr:dihydrodipicolinate synthase family protein [Acidobacteriota bacterium]